METTSKERSSVLSRYFSEIREYPLLTKDEELALAEGVKQGNRAALNELIESNLSFVVKVSIEYRNLGLPFEDLLNEGNIGLIEAAKRYDPGKNVKFITYAVWWVRQAIIHALSDQSGAFRLPQKQANLLYRIGKAQSTLRSELQRAPTAQEVAERIEATLEEVTALLQVADDNISLSAVIDEEHEFHLSDKLEQETIPAADFVFLRQSLRRHITQALGDLDEKEERVLRLRFGLDGSDPKTLKEIGEMMNLSRERIRQIEAQALDKLHRSQKCQQLRGYLN